MLYIIIGYLLGGIEKALKDIKASPVDRPNWTYERKNFFKMFALVALTWFFWRPMMQIINRDNAIDKKSTDKRIAFNLLVSVLTLSIYSLIAWGSIWLAGHVTNYLIVHIFIVGLFYWFLMIGF